MRTETPNVNAGKTSLRPRTETKTAAASLRSSRSPSEKPIADHGEQSFSE
jgi:hypothetical protein